MQRVPIGVVAAALWLGCQGSPAPSKPASPAPSGDAAREPAASAPAPRVSTRPAPTHAVETAQTSAAHMQIQHRQLRGQTLEASPLVHFVPLERPEALEAFHRALRELPADEGGDRKVRIAIYGSSSVAGDRWPGYVRGYLQARFGDGGPGFVAVAPLWKWHRHQEVKLDADDAWTVEHALRAKGQDDGRYGLMGVRATTARAGAELEIRLRGLSPTAERWTPWTVNRPDGGSVVAELGDETSRIETRAESVGPGYAELAAPTGANTLVLTAEGDGRVELLGLVVERSQAGVVLDELGIGGSGARRQLQWDEDLWAANLRRRDPALFVLAYGGIAAMGPDRDPQTWEREFEAVVDRFRRALPKASCLIVGPQDLALRSDGGDQRARPPALDAIIASQRAVASRRGCAFFDTQAMMGGPGTMPKWVDADLAMNDHIHFRKRGYAHMGRVIVDAIMAPYDG